MTVPASDRLIVALDVPDVGAARDLVARLGPAASFYKIGLELLYAGGVEFARELAAGGRQVFLDAKLLDIGHTVERATANIAKLGARFLTVHGTDRLTLDAAVQGRGSSNLALLAVTVMTNLDQAALSQQGIDRTPGDMVLHRARLAAEAGFDGVIASGHEAARVRKALGAGLLIVTPGIRPEGSASGDQARIMTPGKAVAAGADYLVVGRPVTRADDPRRAAEEIASEIGAALST